MKMKILCDAIQRQMAGASMIRKMFEKGIELRKIHGAENVFDFSLGNPDLPPPAQIRDEMIALADRVSKPLGLGYCPNAGLPEVRERLAEFISRQQSCKVGASNVVCTVGAAGALTAFFRAVLEPGDEILCPSPYFVEYGAYCGHFGGVLKPVPSIAPEFQPDLAALAEAIGEKTRVILINTPNNPSGCVYTSETLKQIARLVEQANVGRERPIFLLSDEPYRTVVYDNVEVPPILPLTRWALVLGSFSKTLSMAGERVGYVCVNPEMPEAKLLADAITLTVRTLGSVNAPVIGQRLAAAMLENSIDTGIYTARRNALAKVLDAAGIKYVMPKGTFYFFPEVPGGDDRAFVAKLAEFNVLAVPGSAFGCPGFMRLSFSTISEEAIARSADGFRKAVAAFCE